MTPHLLAPAPQAHARCGQKAAEDFRRMVIAFAHGVALSFLRPSPICATIPSRILPPPDMCLVTGRLMRQNFLTKSIDSPIPALYCDF